MASCAWPAPSACPGQPPWPFRAELRSDIRLGHGTMSALPNNQVPGLAAFQLPEHGHQYFEFRILFAVPGNVWAAWTSHGDARMGWARSGCGQPGGAPGSWPDLSRERPRPAEATRTARTRRM